MGFLGSFFITENRFFFLISLVAVALMNPMLASAQGKPLLVSAEDLPPTLAEEYKVHVGDVLDVSFVKPAGLNQSRTVGPDGNIHLLIIGRVAAEGRTVADLTRELTERYSVEVVDPQITVSLTEISVMNVYVAGEVNEPGVLPYRGGLTLVQAIFDAGGFQNTAHLRNVLLIRKRQDDQPVGTVVDVKEVLSKARFDLDVDLAPLDIIFVPRSKIANVNLWMEQYIKNNLPFDFWIGWNVYRPSAGR